MNVKSLSALSLLVASMTAFGAPDSAPQVKRLGRSVTQVTDENARVAVGYKYASTQLDKPWIFLDTRVSAEGNNEIRVTREDISLVTPDGRRLSLPPQKALATEVKDLRF